MSFSVSMPLPGAGLQEMVRSGIQKAVVEVPATKKKRKSGKSNWPTRVKKEKSSEVAKPATPETKEVGVQTENQGKQFCYRVGPDGASEWIRIGKTLAELEQFFQNKGVPQSPSAPTESDTDLERDFDTE